MANITLYSLKLYVGQQLNCFQSKIDKECLIVLSQFNIR